HPRNPLTTRGVPLDSPALRAILTDKAGCGAQVKGFRSRAFRSRAFRSRAFKSDYKSRVQTTRPYALHD
ncbi:MAG: hypothetical protein RSG78_03075, partial [Oscillospiraceae bacterium]